MMRTARRKNQGPAFIGRPRRFLLCMALAVLMVPFICSGGACYGSEDSNDAAQNTGEEGGSVDADEKKPAFQRANDAAQNTGEEGGSLDADEKKPALQRAWEMVKRGHRFLSKVQNDDGSFSVDPKSKSYAKSAPIAVTSLVCLSLMAGGNTPDSGPFHNELKKGLFYLAEVCDPETGVFRDDLDKTSKMHGQGFAILALSQAYGMFGLKTRSLIGDKLAASLHRAVRLVCNIQTEVGGWYYEPVFSGDHEGSITICIIQGLRASRNAGIHVNSDVIEAALNYVRRSQKADGSFRYRLNDDSSSYALTAAGLATLNAIGEYDSEAIDKGLEYMLEKDPVLNMVSIDQFPQYARFYAAQAYYQYKDLSTWKRWYPRFVKECQDLQYADGSFSNQAYGSVYATATITLTLQIPFGYMPVFQR